MSAVMSLPSRSEPVMATVPRRRIAVVGTGGRASLFIGAVAAAWRGTSELVGLCDSNPLRLAHYDRRLKNEWQHAPVPAYGAESFERMLRETRPDAVVVCTPDHLHADYCVRAMRGGCDAIVEKPMAIDEAGCRAVLDTQRQTGRRVRVTFNCRYIPWALQIKKLLNEGAVGEVLSLDCEWMLDARKGVTYFARWHAQKAFSGGLLVHKSSHHFDLINWWLDAVPQRVFTAGRRGFFGAENKAKHGIGRTSEYYDGENCSTDPFAPRQQWLDNHRDLYLKAAGVDGYRPDRSVWRDHHMDIEDTNAVTIQYRGGVIATYRLHAFLPRAGQHVVINGTRGRLELHSESSGRVATGCPERVPALPPGVEAATLRPRLLMQPMFGDAYEIPIVTAEGSHEGSDPVLMAQLFGPPGGPDPWQRNAGARQGALSALIGITANHSIADGQPHDVPMLDDATAAAHRLSDLV